MQKNKNLVKAINKNVRSSPRKIGLLLKQIKGKKVDIAIRDLSFARQRIAFDIKKTVQSAVANAENNDQYDIDNLYIYEAYVGKSIVLKRFRARAKGRAGAIKKPYSNLTIILAEYGKLLIEDFKIRDYIKKNIVNSGVSQVIIERKAKKCIVSIYTSRPGFVIGKKGSDVDKIKKNLSKISSSEIALNINTTPF